MKSNSHLSKACFFAVLVLLLSYCSNSDIKQEQEQEQVQTINKLELEKLFVENMATYPHPSSIRALKAIDDNTAWFAGSGGVFGYTENGGNSWVVDSIKTDTIVPHFRSIAVTDEAVFLLSIASPALLYRSTDKGKNWSIVYREDHPNAFYDALAFWDNQYGIAMGDPTDGCLSVIRTEDGGQTWSKVSCSKIPAAGEGEAAFAASNSNIALNGQTAWIVSGGAKARVYKSDNRGLNWKVFETPIAQGGQMTGIYSVAFLDQQNGIIFGGDWNSKEINAKNKAITRDGGQTWTLLADGQGPGYRSHVKYIPETGNQGIIACGIPGVSYSLDGGTNWINLLDASYYTMDFGSNYKVLWLAGNNKIARIKFQ